MDISEILIEHGKELLFSPKEFVRFTEDYEADTLLNDMDNYPHAFVIAVIMNRQIKVERAWTIPYKLKQRLGSFDFQHLANLSEKEILEAMIYPEPLHRLKNIMSKNIFFTIERVANTYDGVASRIWDDNPNSALLVLRFLEFDGVGLKIATMASNILVRDFKISVRDKYSLDISPDRHVYKVFNRLDLLREGASNEELIYTARSLYSEYPGIFDLPAWEIGQDWCHKNNPSCQECYMVDNCPYVR